MLDKVTLDTYIANIAERLKEFDFVLEGWLFGSYAYGTPTDESDLDLCAIVKDGTYCFDNYGAVRLSISQALDFSFPADLVMVEKSAAETNRDRKDLVYFDIFTNGKRFYSAR